MQINYFYLKNSIQIKGLGVILKVKKEFIKIKYSINLGILKIDKNEYQFLRNDVYATSLHKLKIALKTEISNAWREFIDEKDENLTVKNLKIKQNLIENFEELLFHALIPETSLKPLKYISGYSALNLHFTNTGSGDWHFAGTYAHHCKLDTYDFLYGENCQNNINHILGNIEIIEISNFLKNQANINFIGNKCYCASHCRAVADLVINQVLNDKALNNININYCNYINIAYIDEFLFTTKEQLRVIELVKMAFPYLNDYQKKLINAWCQFKVYLVR